MNKNIIGVIFLLILIAFCQFAFIGCKEENIYPNENNKDYYEGDCRSFTIHPSVLNIDDTEFVLYIKTPNGTILKRKAFLSNEKEADHISLEVGLNDNDYRLLYVEYENPNIIETKFPRIHSGLGCKMRVKDGNATILDVYDEKMNLYIRQGETKSYTISSGDHLMNLAKKVNSDTYNIDSTYTFVQENKIDLEWACYKANAEYGWNPIGASNNTPFRATYVGDTITGLTINRPNTFGVGLFGYTSMAQIREVEIYGAKVNGDYATGALIGVVTHPGGVVTATTVDSCVVAESVVTGSTYNKSDKGVDIGGMIGAVDERAMLMLTNSKASGNTVSATYNAGGFVGAGIGLSVVVIAGCESIGNTITSEVSGAGGVIASADSLYIHACVNRSTIKGSTLMVDGGSITGYDGTQEYTIEDGIGTGGIVGGAGGCYIFNSINEGSVTGDEGVGGILGSTRVKGGKNEGDETYLRNYAMIKYCGNKGSVEGNIFVGGICGESNAGIYGAYNTGLIKGKSHVGGILGVAQIVAAHNVVNSGVVDVDNYEGNSFAGGVVGMADIVSLALSQNYGQVMSMGVNTGGIIGMSGTTSVIHQCANFADVSSEAAGATGGIVGLLGKPSEWGPLNTAEVLLGALDMLLAVIGPVVAYVEHGASLAGHIVLTVYELALELPTMALESYFLYHSCHHIIHTEELARIQASVNVISQELGGEVKKSIGNIRNNSYDDLDVNSFNASLLKDNYIAGIENTIAYYENDGGGKYYNNSINAKRNELSDEVEDYTHKKDVAHSVLSGIALGASFIFTTAAIVSSFITGGSTASLVFVGLGSIASIMGGTVAISKACTEFENNSVIVSQCVNAATVTSGSSKHTGGLVGELSDFGIVRDCLNTANGNGKGGGFLGTAGDRSILQRCLNLGENYEASTVVDSKQMDKHEDLYVFTSDGSDLSADEIANRDSYDGWDIGDGENLWTIPSGNKSFPIPNFSEMREKSK